MFIPRIKAAVTNSKAPHHMYKHVVDPISRLLPVIAIHEKAITRHQRYPVSRVPMGQNPSKEKYTRNSEGAEIHAS